MTYQNNQPVTVTAFHFTKQFETIPRRIEIDGVSYELQADYKKISFQNNDVQEDWFDLSDGSQTFRLRGGGTSNWHLVNLDSNYAKV